MTPSAIISLVVALLKFANFIMDTVQRERLMKAGADAEIAKVSAAILRKTQAGKKIMEKVDAMSEADVDSELRQLGIK